jgi:hypothetical protein
MSFKLRERVMMRYGGWLILLLVEGANAGEILM